MSSPKSASHTTPPGGEHGDFRPLIFGETLFDHFPDGSRVLGGAPFNVAWHLQGFKANPLLVTAVGRDLEGDSIRETMEEWGMDTSGVQFHPSRPTGRVTARFHAGEPRYEIEANQAYDFVKPGGLPGEEKLSACGLLYHGSLALRTATSGTALALLGEILGTPRLVDVNLRPPWWDRNGVLHLLEGAQWAKLNREEAGLLSGSRVESTQELEDAAGALRNSLGIDNMVVTLGAHGALALTPEEVLWQTSPEVTDVKDTVGAGDAFSAVLAMGIHGAWPVPLILARAVAFAAELCRVQGAIPRDPDLYSRHLREWDHAD